MAIEDKDEWFLVNESKQGIYGLIGEQSAQSI
jgi:hypothetical protein